MNSDATTRGWGSQSLSDEDGFRWLESRARRPLRSRCAVSFAYLLEPHGHERLAGQLEFELAGVGAVDGRDSHLPGIDDIGAVVCFRREIEFVFGRLVEVE